MRLEVTTLGSTTTEAGFFGAEERLFGVAQLPAGEPRGAVLVCSPIQSELFKNNRREVVLSRRLAENGIAVLRFHYRGAGNSDGAPADLTLASMTEDTVTALAHLVGRAGTDEVGLVGTRLGAMAAAAAAPPGAPLALWEPALDGRRYFRDLLRSLLIVGLKRSEEASETRESLLARFEREGTLDIMGFSVGWRLHEDTVGRRLEAGPTPRSILLVQLARAPQLRAEYASAVQGWEQAGHRVTVEPVAYEEAWWFHEDVDVLTPEAFEGANRHIVERTADWLTAEVGT